MFFTRLSYWNVDDGEGIGCGDHPNYIDYEKEILIIILFTHLHTPTSPVIQ